MPADESIEALVEAARAGDVHAQGEIFDRYHRAVHRYAWSRLRSVQDAEDVAAETFVAAFGAIPRFRWQGVPFEAWLFRIASSKIVDLARRRRVGDVPLDATDGDSFDASGHGLAMDHVLQRLELAEALGQLPRPQHDVIVLRFVLGRSIREVARMMGRSEGAVKQLQARALLRLRHEVER
ncbi:MAG TPA: sigma-70 family RNA polymerase sigma factor [Candidatus Limnocylindria bacterium]|nr:sigma-70 family RNA polymerase sigma factor [Candidatus Limnocylindria bacterium]